MSVESIFASPATVPKTFEVPFFGQGQNGANVLCVPAGVYRSDALIAAHAVAIAVRLLSEDAATIACENRDASSAIMAVSMLATITEALLEAAGA